MCRINLSDVQMQSYRVQSSMILDQHDFFVVNFSFGGFTQIALEYFRQQSSVQS